jgi:hypothetical protein
MQISFTDTDPLKGLWFREQPGGLGAPVRFYYFHGDGNGLYRYGKIGYTNTNSYDYSTKGDTLTLNFRKTGETLSSKFRIVKENGVEWLTIENDPREKGARYFKERQNISEQGLLRCPGVQFLSALGDASSQRVDGFMWIEATAFKTGGFGFSIYQFREAGIDGRGTGWFHQGDFNDWSTESLQYRIYRDSNANSFLELAFELRPEDHTTRFVLSTKEKKRFITLDEDPRNFWHRRTYQEMGKSF